MAYLFYNFLKPILINIGLVVFAVSGAFISLYLVNIFMPVKVAENSIIWL